MKLTRFSRVWALGIVALLGSASARAAQTDPYVVLDKYIAANGGLDKMKSQHTMHMKGTLVIEGAGLQGPFEQWTQQPNKSLQTLDLKVFRQTQGDNGQTAWTVDQNNKLQINRDSTTLKERQIRILMAEFDHLSRTSKTFKAAFEKIDTALGKVCFAIKTTNNINDYVYFDYYDTTNFQTIKNVVDRPNQIVNTYMSDFRTIAGFDVPYQIRTVEEPTNQISTIKFDTVEINLPIDAKIFEPPASDVKDYEFANGKSVENVPFKYIENHVYIPVTINGRTKLWVLDTGAEVSVIDNQFAEELGLKLEGKMTGQGVGSTVDVAFTTLPAYSLNGLSFQEQKIASIKLNWLFKKTMGQEIGGILGYDFLSRLVTRIDYANQTLSFYEPDSFKYSGPGVVIDAPLSQDNMFHVPITVDGQYGGLWNIDVGAAGMSFHFPYAQSHDLLKLKGVNGVAYGAGGTSPNKSCQFKTVTLAGFTVDKPLVGMPISADKGSFSGRELTGNAGNTLFRHFVLYLDYHHEKFIVEKGADFAKVFPEDHSGLQLAYDDSSRVETISAADGTPAAKAGVKVGDKIKTIDGKTPEALGGVMQIREMLKAAPGTKYSLELDAGRKDCKGQSDIEESLQLRDRLTSSSISNQ